MNMIRPIVGEHGCAWCRSPEVETQEEGKRVIVTCRSCRRTYAVEEDYSVVLLAQRKPHRGLAGGPPDTGPPPMEW